MQELQIFSNTQFGEIRTTQDKDGKTLFCASDVAKALGYAIPSKAVNTHCKGVSKMESRVKTGVKADGALAIQTVEMLFIPEGDVYRLIVRSKLPSAEQFEHWVFDEVLPSIRKHGIYATDDTIDNIIKDPDFGIKLLTELKQEREEKRQLQDQIKHQKPLVDFASTVQGSDTNILIRQTSKFASNYIGVDIGEKGLYQRLREWGFVCKTKNEPTRKAYLQGVLEYVERPTRIYPYTAMTTMVTPNGQIYIVNRLVKECSEGTVA